LFAAVIAASACAPLGGSGRARVLPRGDNELTASAEAMLIAPEFNSDNIVVPWAQFGIGYHRGLSERFEAGARAWGLSFKQFEFQTGGAALDSKFQLAFQERDRAAIDIALAPSVGYHRVALGGTPEHMMQVSLPLLMGVAVGQRHHFIVAPRVTVQRWWGQSQYAQTFVLGGVSVGIALRVGKRWVLHPEATFMWSPVPFGGEDPATTRRGLSLLSLGFGTGLLF
jgi:hypothetical protein